MKIKEINSMKKTLTFLAALAVASAGVVLAASVYNAYLVNQTVTANQNFTLNLNTVPNGNGITHISAQAVYSSATVATNTFTDGRASTGSITVVSTAPLVAAYATDNITMPSTAQLTPIAATNYFTVVSTAGMVGQYLSVNGAIVQDSQFIASTASGTATALNAYLQKYYANQFVSTVTVGGTTIYSTATIAGSGGNNFTFFSSSPSALSIGGANFAGGTNSALLNAYISVNGRNYHTGYLWQDTGISSNTAKSFHDNVLQFIPGIVSTVTAGSSVIYATAAVPGTAGNAFTFAASTPTIVIGSANFAGGQNAAQFCVNAICLTEGVQWTLGSSSTTATTAASIYASIGNSTPMSSIIASSNTTGSAVVSATSTAVGASSNYALTSSAPSALSVSGAFMMGGSNSAFQNGSPLINIPSNGLSTGYGVVFSTPAGTGITPLVNGTTYYAISVDANDIELASSLSNAVAQTPITLTSHSTAGPHTFTLTPQAYSGTASMAWYGSVDCVNYNPVSISSLTVTSPTTAPQATLWNFGRVNYVCLQLQVIAPTQGGLNLAVKVNGKD